MGFDLSSIMEGGVSGLFKGAKDAVSAFKADPAKVLEIDASIRTLEANVNLALAQGQMKINEIEAASDSLFKSGWRPAVGWTCAAGVFYEFLFRPIVQSIVIFWYPSYQMVSLDMTEIMGLLSGILGLGILKTYEKSKSHIPAV